MLIILAIKASSHVREPQEKIERVGGGADAYRKGQGWFTMGGGG
jgi:hypothetical protein